MSESARNGVKLNPVSLCFLHDSIIFALRDPNLLPENHHITHINEPEADETNGASYSQEVTEYLTDNQLPASLKQCNFVHWSTFIKQTQSYMVFKAAPDELVVETKPRDRKCRLWTTMYPMLYEQGMLFSFRKKSHIHITECCLNMA